MLEEVKFLQKQREKKSGIPAISVSGQAGGASNGSSGGLMWKGNDKTDGDGEKDDLVLQDTFAQETAVMVEDPNMYAIFRSHAHLLFVLVFVTFCLSTSTSVML